jgi:hypothetical protein
LASELGCVEYFEVGAATGQGLEQNLFDLLYEKHVKPKREETIANIMLHSRKAKKKKPFSFFNRINIFN